MPAISRYSATRLQKNGGERMTDYEMIMIFLTILGLIIMAVKKNDR